MTRINNLNPSLHHSFIGFDRLMNDLLTFEKTIKTNTYPPYNIVQVEENAYVIEMAIAGFSQNDLDITLEKNKLSIKGLKKKTIEEDEYVYLHKGISSKSFEQSFTLSPSVIVKNAECKDGVLTIYLQNVIPEEDKPKKIQIGVPEQSTKQILNG